MFHPLFNVAARLAVRSALREKNVPRSVVRDAVAVCDDDLLADAAFAAAVPAEFHADAPVAADGEPPPREGELLQRFFAWLKSDAGKAWIKLIVTIVLAMFGL